MSCRSLLAGQVLPGTLLLRTAICPLDQASDCGTATPFAEVHTVQK
jgi:hypothetical protein